MKIKVIAEVIYHDLMGKLVKGQVLENVEKRIYNSIKDHVQVIEDDAKADVKKVEYDTKVLIQNVKSKIVPSDKGAKK